jgi:hypothetical protein
MESVNQVSLRKIMLIKIYPQGWALVVHAYNSTCLGGRDQEDRSPKPTGANSSQDPILKILNTKKEWQSCSTGIALASMRP